MKDKADDLDPARPGEEGPRTSALSEPSTLLTSAERSSLSGILEAGHLLATRC
jgi:hypothetical protein